MKIDAAQFFQPVSIPATDGKRATLTTSARSELFDISLDGNYIRVAYKNCSRAVYVTIFNTCWFIPLEESSEPNSSKTDLARDAAPKGKRGAVVKHKLPTTDRIHPGSGEA